VRNTSLLLLCSCLIASVESLSLRQADGHCRKVLELVAYSYPLHLLRPARDNPLPLIPIYTITTMASNRTRRIAKEVADIQADKLSQIIVEPAGNEEDMTHLRGQFRGPPDTPYEGGTYNVDIRIPPEYPFRPPVMKFETKIWHPNVSSQTVTRDPSGITPYTNMP
jgi:hypothetical protein